MIIKVIILVMEEYTSLSQYKNLTFDDLIDLDFQYYIRFFIDKTF